MRVRAHVAAAARRSNCAASYIIQVFSGGYKVAYIAELVHFGALSGITSTL